MKYSDDLYDVKSDLKFASIFGVLCAIASALATLLRKIVAAKE